MGRILHGFTEINIQGHHANNYYLVQYKRGCIIMICEFFSMAGLCNSWDAVFISGFRTTSQDINMVKSAGFSAD